MLYTFRAANVIEEERRSGGLLDKIESMGIDAKGFESSSFSRPTVMSKLLSNSLKTADSQARGSQLIPFSAYSFSFC